jgi:GNAT superfamily N-acetyltransferase
MVGITHYLFHTSTWAPRVCYLQDLYVSETHRGQGTAAALIDAVAQAAQQAGAQRLYWLTQSDNLRARRLYDRVASTAASSVTTTHCRGEERR